MLWWVQAVWALLFLNEGEMRSKRHQSGTAKSKTDAAGIHKCLTGIHGLDEITQGGIPRGRTTLVCGWAGCGKTLIGMEFLVRGATEFDEPGVCLSFEETGEELAANVASLGFDVARLIKQKKLVIDHVYLERSLIEETGEYDLEALFIRLGHAVDSIGAKRVLLDSVEALFSGLTKHSLLRAELRRLFRWLKERNLTAIVTGERGQNTLTRHGLEEYLSDCVILLDHRVTESVMTRRLRLIGIDLKRWVLVTGHGIELREVYLGEAGLLTGSALVMQEAKAASENLQGRQDIERKQPDLERKRKALDAQIAALQLELGSEELASQPMIAQEQLKVAKWEQDRGEMAKCRLPNQGPGNGSGVRAVANRNGV